MQERNVIQSAAAVQSIANCIALAALLSRALADQCARNKCVLHLVSMLGKHTSADFYLSQALSCLHAQSVHAQHSLRQPGVLATVVRRFHSERGLGTRAKLAEVLLTLDDVQLERLNLSRGAMRRAVRDFKPSKLAPVRTSLADNI